MKPYGWRDRAAVWLANQVLRLASPRYRAMVKGAIRHGLESTATGQAQWCRNYITRTYGDSDPVQFRYDQPDITLNYAPVSPDIARQIADTIADLHRRQLPRWRA
jgi:hypothetical protein